MASPFRKQPRVTAPAAVEAYPELLDGSQWTQAATFSHDQRWTGPSDRIGRNYRQQLNELNDAQLQRRKQERMTPASPLRPTVERKGWAPGLGVRPLLQPGRGSGSAAEAGESSFAILSRQRAAEEAGREELFRGTKRKVHETNPETMQARFDDYVTHGIDESCLAGFNQAWVVNALEQVPRELAGMPPDAVDERLEQMLGELHEQYYTAVKRSMVQYVLKNPAEGRRVEITAPPAPFALTTFHPSHDESVAECAKPTSRDSLSLGIWHEHVLASYEIIERSLLINHEGMLQMLEVWALYENYQLCNLGQLPSVGAIELERFKDMQHSHCEKVMQMLKKKWFPSVLDIFRRESAAERSEDLGGDAAAKPRASADAGSPLLMTASALMFTQLRALLHRSIDKFVAFFEQYAAVPADGADEPKALLTDDVRERPLVLTRMLVEGEGFKFSPSAPAVAKSLLSIIDFFVGMMNTIPRIEGEVGKGAGGSRLLTVANLDEEVIVNAKRRLQEIVDLNMEQTNHMVRAYTPFVYLLSAEADRKLDDFNKGAKALGDYTTEIGKFERAVKDIGKRTLGDVRLGLVLASCQAVKQKLAQRAEELAGRLRSHISAGFNAKNAEMCDRYSAIFVRLADEPTNDEEMVALETFLHTSAELLAKLNSELNEQRKTLRFLTEQSVQFGEEDLKKVGDNWSWSMRIKPRVEECLKRLKAKRNAAEDDLTLRREQFVEELDGYVTESEAYAGYGDINDVQERVSGLNLLTTKMKEAKARAEALNEEEVLLGFPVSQFAQLEEVPKILASYLVLWNTVSDFKSKAHAWLSGPMLEVDPEVVESEAKMMWKTNFKTIKAFQESDDLPAPLTVAEMLKTQIDDFQAKLPLITCLCNKGMHDRHWEQVGDVLGYKFRPNETTTLNSVLDDSLSTKLEQLEEISGQASKEFSLEKALSKMWKEWQPLEFTTMEYRDTGTSIIGGTEEIQLLLDDHLVKSQTMLGSPFIKPFKERAKKWADQLALIQDLIDIWLKVQGMWQYLEPIFGSEDIMKQMPKEGALFKKQDALWRDYMKKVVLDVRALAISEIPGILASYQEQHSLLEQVQKGLNEYLEMKRLYFARFFFLSNDEMLEILSETKDPTRVQPHLGKCFEGIGKLTFEADNTITAMVSAEGERVEFTKKIKPSSMVEQWLLEVEQQMFDAMRRIVDEGAADYPTRPRPEWVLKWQGQVVLTVTVMMWTRDVDEALSEGGNAALAAYADKCSADLDDIVKLVRGQLSKLERKVVSPLIVMDVHARDVLKQMAADGISRNTDFDWLAQLRYYPTADEPGNVRVRMISTDLPYGYEYIGLQGRLVVTPLTDRCYRTLMGALQLDLGGAPEGPAGTGKTETTKDLGKAMAIQTVVMNCSDGLDYLAMAKFFKGLASAGAWACFDEFNRIDIEVLSVIAQQILTIIRAKTMKAEKFDFEGSTLPLRPMCNSFITMNPGYAGRAELPDNLKALFRTVAMMVPDYAMIGEVLLLSSGYLEARPCARKIVQTYKLCSEQLSSQDHYDYGMRAVMAVLRAAGNLKRQFLDEDENVLMLRSILDVNLPKFLSHDVPLFEGITSDLFPGVELPKADYDLLHETCQKYCDEVNLQLTEKFFNKITQLYEMIIVRHGLMIVGYSYGAKTSMYRTLAAALTEMKARGANEEAAHYLVLNPKSITMGQLYGQFDPTTHEWSDGVLAVTYRFAAQQEKIHNIPDRQWVMFDGPVDAIWIENMNTVLDDNKKLCLMSGEMIGMSGPMSMIFEVQDLAVASPATVSRCGMVYVEPSQIGWEPLLDSWLKTLPEALTEYQPKLRNLFGWLVPPCLRFVNKECKSTLTVGIQATDEVTRVRACMTLMTSLFVELRDPEFAASLTKELPLWVENLFTFALVWTVGGVIVGDSRPKFDTFLRQVAEGKPPRGFEKVDGVFGSAEAWASFIPAQEGATCFDFTFNKGTHRWQHWVDTISKEETLISPKAEFANIIVPTVDTARYTMLLTTLLLDDKPVLFVGPTGTGKTSYVQKKLLALPGDKWNSIFINFSAQTSANQTQDIIDAKLDKRRKGVFGPPMGKQCVIFVDDLNMPQLETYGAQPPIELLRQYMDHAGWYDRKENTFRKLVDLSFICAMGPPGGGRNPITPRYMRHFNLIAYTTFDDQSMQRIFQTILEWWLKKEGFGPEYLRLGAPIIAATMDAYKESMINLLPTPSKSHYTFNLRDFARVVQGILLTSAADFEKSSDLTLCWVHELLRVFYDRLTDDDDRAWFLECIKGLTMKHFDTPAEELLKEFDMNCSGDLDDDDVRYLLFCDFSNPKGKRTYKRVPDVPQLQTLMNGMLDDYNQVSNKPMKLVLFLFAVEHICRISRVLLMPRGNALLAGVGGSGRQSVTRLAAYICDCEVFQIEVSKSYSRADWREDLKKILRNAGAQGKGTVFLFADTQIKEESYLEDINGLLNAGEVPNLFPNDEKGQVCDAVRDAAREEEREGDGSLTTMFAYFVERCRKFLHIALAMSPIGEAFRRRLRMFPSLVNCCTIDWFRPWPADALDAVASTFLAEVEMEKHN